MGVEIGGRKILYHIKTLKSIGRVVSEEKAERILKVGMTKS